MEILPGSRLRFVPRPLPVLKPPPLHARVRVANTPLRASALSRPPASALSLLATPSLRPASASPGPSLQAQPFPWDGQSPRPCDPGAVGTRRDSWDKRGSRASLGGRDMERRWVFVLLDVLCVLVGKSLGTRVRGSPRCRLLRSLRLVRVGDADRGDLRSPLPCVRPASPPGRLAGSGLPVCLGLFPGGGPGSRKSLRCRGAM